MAAQSQPHLVVIAGPNGAGKSTFARRAIHRMRLSSFVNADVIAQGLAGVHPEGVAMEAGRVMLKRLKELADRRPDFAFETTLSGRSYGPWIKGLIQAGYFFQLIFVTLRDADLAVERVKQRIQSGGHHVPEADIRRRFQRGIRNFFECYQPLADRWSVYDNSSVREEAAALIASGERLARLDIMDAGLWSNFRRHGDATP